MSLRGKIVITLLGVFALFVLAAWMVLSLVHTPAFENLEQTQAEDQLLRVSEFIEAEREYVEWFTTDWATWDDTMMFAAGDYDEFFDDNLVDGYLGALGFSFGIIVDAKQQLVWGEAYPSDGSITSLDYLFPVGIPEDSELLSPVEHEEQISGLIDTAQGPAIITSAPVLWSDASGPAGGHFITGKLVDSEKLNTIGRTLLSTVGLFPVDLDSIPSTFQPAVVDLLNGDRTQAIVKRGNGIYGLKLLHDVEGQSLSILHVRNNANISALGSKTVFTTILMLIVAAVVLTVTLWLVLKDMFLLPIEQLTAVLRGGDNSESLDSNHNLHTTMKRLTDSRGSFSQRNDEIGELISAFDDLSDSLREATNNVWKIAHQDGLTGLANRRFLVDRFCSIIDKSQVKSRIALLFIDLDNFKPVNDQLGHESGDKLLIEVAHRIKTVVGVESKLAPGDSGRADVVARIGGDEFVVMLTHGDLPGTAHDVAAEIVATVAEPYSLGEEQCTIGACVGMALYPDDAEDFEGIVAKADAAMYEAKRAGKNTWRRYGTDAASVGLRKSA